MSHDHGHLNSTDDDHGTLVVEWPDRPGEQTSRVTLLLTLAAPGQDVQLRTFTAAATSNANHFLVTETLIDAVHGDADAWLESLRPKPEKTTVDTPLPGLWQRLAAALAGRPYSGGGRQVVQQPWRDAAAAEIGDGTTQRSLSATLKVTAAEYTDETSTVASSDGSLHRVAKETLNAVCRTMSKRLQNLRYKSADW